MIAFIAVIYGMYIKISSKSSKNYDINEIASMSLMQNQKIKEIQVIDNNRILITIEDDDEIQGIIYNIDTQEIVQRIKK